MTGAIMRETVPATIMRSDCLGDARKTPAPKRSRSYREETLAIISMAQQANPKVMGHNADFLAQLTTASRFVVTIFASNCRSRLTCFHILFSDEGRQSCPSLRAFLTHPNPGRAKTRLLPMRAPLTESQSIVPVCAVGKHEG